MSVVFVCGGDIEENRPDGESLNGTGSYAPSFNSQAGQREGTGPGTDDKSRALYKTAGASRPMTGENKGNSSSIRAYFWIAKGGADESDFRNLFCLSIGNQSWIIRCDGLGRLQMAYADAQGFSALATGTNGTAITEPSLYQLPGNVWTPIEVSISSSGLFELFVGGNAVLAANATAPTGSGSAYLSITRLDSLQFAYDHIVWTLGPRLTGPEGTVFAVAPTASVSANTTLLTNFYGIILKNGQRYDGSNVRSVRAWANGAGAPAYTGYSVFACDPETGDPWGHIDELDFDWGFCTRASGGWESRIHAMGLSIVTMVDGFIKVLCWPPSTLTYRSGTWTKTHPDLPMAAHLMDRPRDFAETERYIYTTVPGCVVTKLSPSIGLFGDGVTFAEEKRDDLLDWVDVIGEGLPYESFFMSGFNVLAEGNKDFQSNYVTVQYEPVPQGGAYIRGAWDYSENVGTNRWSIPQDIYRLSGGDYFAKMARLKIRGRGKSVQLRVDSDENKPFSISGWTMAASSNGTV